MEKHDYAIHLADVADAGTLVEVLDGEGGVVAEAQEVADVDAALKFAGEVIAAQDDGE